MTVEPACGSISFPVLHPAAYYDGKMDPLDDLSVRAHPHRCDHCGRVVGETQHTRTSYRVDYYALHTGAVELCSMVTGDWLGKTPYLKLVSRLNVVTCSDCYSRTAVQREREQRFRPEQTTHEEQDGRE